MERKEKMKRIWIGIMLILAFGLGYYLRMFSAKPQVIIKTITKEERVYDFTQESQAMQAYLNTMNKVLMDKDEFEREKIKLAKEQEKSVKEVAQMKDELEKKSYRDNFELRLKRSEIWQEGYMEGFRAIKK